MRDYFGKPGTLFFAISMAIGLAVSGCKTAPKKDEGKKESAGFIEKAPPVEEHGMTRQPVIGIENLEVFSVTPGEASKVADNSYLIQIPIGTKEPMRCSYIKGDDSPVYVMKGFFEKISQRPDVESFSVTALSAGVMGKVPMLSATAAYQQSGGVRGYVESVTLSTIGFVIFCYIEEEGFTEPLKTSVESLAGSGLVSNLLGRITSVSSRDVYVVKLNEKAIGYTENYLFDDGKGIFNYYMISNYFITRPDGGLYVGEIIEDVYADSKTGQVKSAKYFSSQNNAREYKLDLKEVKDGSYLVTGTHKGTPLEKTLEAGKGNLVSLDHLIAKTTAGPKSARGKTLRILQFHPSYPDQLMESELLVNELEKDSAKFTYKSGPITIDYETDSNGIQIMKMENKSMKMLWERLFTEKSEKSSRDKNVK